MLSVSFSVFYTICCWFLIFTIFALYFSLITSNISITHKGIIPDGIANLQSLTEMDLSGNQLSGSLPDSIGELKALVKLSLQQNDLSGACVCEGRVCLFCLLLFKLNSSCSLSGWSIKEGAYCTVSLLYPSFTVLYHICPGVIPDSFCGLSLLTDLNISNCCLTGTYACFLANLDMFRSTTNSHMSCSTC